MENPPKAEPAESDETDDSAKSPVRTKIKSRIVGKRVENDDSPPRMGIVSKIGARKGEGSPKGIKSRIGASRKPRQDSATPPPPPSPRGAKENVKVKEETRDPAPKLELTMEEKALRKRLQLKKALNEKGQKPVAKVRKF